MADFRAVSVTQANGRLGARDPRLQDAGWLGRMYASHGDREIAAELGVNRKTVRAARQRLGIASQGVGRRRGSVNGPESPPTEGAGPGAKDPRNAQAAILERIGQERGKIAPTDALLASRLVALHHARVNRDELAREDALIGIASVAALMFEHRARR